METAPKEIIFEIVKWSDALDIALLSRVNKSLIRNLKNHVKATKGQIARMAAKRGYLDVIIYDNENGNCLYDDHQICSNAAEGGHLAVLYYCKKNWM